MQRIKAPLISVVLATHDRPILLRRALESLLKQTFSDFEIVLCADETHIGTKKVAFELLRADDTFLCSPHLRGPSESRNVGLSLARGDWICFLDDDDSFDEDYFENFVSVPGERDSIAFSNYARITETRDADLPVIIDREIVSIVGTPVETLYLANFLPINSVFIPRNIAKSRAFDIDLKTHEDWEYFVALKSSGHEFKGLDALVGPNVHLCDSATRNKGASIPLDYLAIYRKWPARSDVVRKSRVSLLARWGIDVPEEFL